MLVELDSRLENIGINAKMPSGLGVLNKYLYQTRDGYKHKYTLAKIIVQRTFTFVAICGQS